MTTEERRERERAYFRDRYKRLKETDPEKWAAQMAKRAEDRRRRMADPEYAAKHRAAVAAKGRAQRRAAKGLPPDAVLAPMTPEERRESIRLKSRIYRRRKAGLPDDPNLPMPMTPRPKLTEEERKARDREKSRRRWEAKKKARLEQERARRAAEIEVAKAAAQPRQEPTQRQKEIAAAYAAGHRAPAPRKMSRFEALRKWNSL